MWIILHNRHQEPSVLLVVLLSPVINNHFGAIVVQVSAYHLLLEVLFIFSHEKRRM